ncbi:MAG: DNA polymerase I [Lachnospiraceae bacterium]|nr:DNA polymerase I [Lachnospiraceae bacterium]
MKPEASKVLLMDGHSILNRAYYGLPDLTDSKGRHTNAVYGFLNMMFKYIETEEPTHFGVAFDESAPTFRHEMYSAYKGTRKPMDPELKSQVPMIKEMLTAMNVPIFSQPGLEADDILGTLSKAAEEKGMEVTVVSGDRDLLQLASDHIKISIPKTKKTGTEIEDYYASDVKEKKGVTPEEFIDVKALMGDASDNIPGVPSIGEKTATAIIAQYHSIENAHEHVAELKPPRASKNLEEFYDQAVLSKTLATIEVHADIPFIPKEITDDMFFTNEAYLLCKEWELKSLVVRFENRGDNKNDIEGSFKKFGSIEDLKSLKEKAASGKKYAGISLLFLKNPFAENMASDGDKAGRTLYGAAFSTGDETGFITTSSASEEDIIGEIQNYYDDGCTVSLRGLKTILPYFSFEDRSRIFDTETAAYLLNPLAGEYPACDIAKTELSLIVSTHEELFGKGKSEKAYNEEPEKAFTYACYEAYTSYAAKPLMEEKLKSLGMEDLYRDIELPLTYALYNMEKEGLAMDGEALKAYGRKLGEKIEETEKKIYEEAGEEFNISSPKQLGTILFEKLSLPYGKKTKTGYSTAADVLEKLKYEYPIVENILSYRTFSKLKSTYADGLLPCLAADGRVHSSFQQTVTATGRISSTEPNLQNIPVRIEQGKLIRKVFHPKDGYVYIDADYSQIELRVLAHLSGDPALIEAYLNGQDIHRSTASKVFHKAFDEVTELDRRRAKAVNFGIVYGISAFGLSQDLNIDRKEAQDYIDSYFDVYPVLHEYIKGLVESAKEKGYAETLFGRRRPVPELTSSNFMQRQFGERVAMNSPVQGTAADIIKIAMVKVHDALKDRGLKSKLVLQVHDELLIETEISEKEEVENILRREMENAVKLRVPLEIDMHEGATWYDAK